MEAKTGIVSLMTVGTLVAAVWAADEHFARAADVRGLGESLSRQIELNRLSGEADRLEQRRVTLLDKLYDGAAQQRKPNAGDRAIAQRYGAELKDVDQTLRDKRRQIDQLRRKP